MKYLAISKTPYYIAYAVFNNKSLFAYGKIELKDTNQLKRIVEWETLVDNLIKDHEPTFLLTHMIELDKMMKKDLERLVEIKTILRKVSELNKVIYMEYRTSGWEKKLIGRITEKRKIKFINDGYGIENSDVEIANAIILGEGVAWDRLQVAR